MNWSVKVGETILKTYKKHHYKVFPLSSVLFATTLHWAVKKLSTWGYKKVSSPIVSWHRVYTNIECGCENDKKKGHRKWWLTDCWQGSASLFPVQDWQGRSESRNRRAAQSRSAKARVVNSCLLLQTLQTLTPKQANGGDETRRDETEGIDWPTLFLRDIMQYSTAQYMAWRWNVLYSTAYC